MYICNEILNNPQSDVWKSQHKGRRTASHFNDANAKVKKLMRKTSQSVKCKVSPLLAKLLLLDNISELPSIRWGCMHKEDAAIMNTSVPIQ